MPIRVSVTIFIVFATLLVVGFTAPTTTASTATNSTTTRNLATTCTASSSCASGCCINGVCSSSASSCGTYGYYVTGASCTLSSQCYSFCCLSNGRCGSSSSSCSSSSTTSATTCSNNTQCSTGCCNNGYCASSFICGKSGTYTSGTSCTSNSQCTSGICCSFGSVSQCLTSSTCTSYQNLYDVSDAATNLTSAVLAAVIVIPLVVLLLVVFGVYCYFRKMRRKLIAVAPTPEGPIEIGEVVSPGLPIDGLPYNEMPIGTPLQSPVKVVEDTINSAELPNRQLPNTSIQHLTGSETPQGSTLDITHQLPNMPLPITSIQQGVNRIALETAKPNDDPKEVV